MEKTKNIEDVRERLPILLADEGKAGDFYRQTFYDLFKYCSNRIPEIADELYRVDQAVSAGFAWEVGPFESWDSLGVAETVAKMKEAGFEPAKWVQEMLDAGNKSFYTIRERQETIL